VPDLAVADVRRLIEAAAGLHAHLPDACVLEQHPTLQHVDELHFAVMRVPFAVRRLPGTRADHVRDHLAARGALDAKVAVFEVGSQAATRELRAVQVRDVEAFGVSF